MAFSTAAASKLAFQLGLPVNVQPPAHMVMARVRLRRPPVPTSSRTRRCCSSLHVSSSSADAFTKLEHTNWQRGVDAYNDGFGPLTSQAVPTLLDKVQFPPPTLLGDRSSAENISMLDVACGPGQVLTTAISKANESGCTSCSYTALDFSSNFLQLAKCNLDSAHPDATIDFVEGDAQSMPFENDVFTSITCNFGILHLSDPDSFISESYRILQPGGRLAFSAWSAIPYTEGFDLILGAVDAAGNPTVQLPEGPPFFRFSDPKEIDQSLEASGFADIEVTVVESMIWENVKSADHLYSILLEGTARTRELLRGQTEEEAMSVKEELRRRYEERTENGSKGLRMPAVVSSGRKPLTYRY
mmetsp:Transcript_31896/g.64939  ORF Transcript_31896/g.64939 Transcript_31896/m.64939 type:complete len:358 (-) Transcript_31896:55-1128(-)